MNKDISTIKDIEFAVNTFYEKVRKDKVIGYIFNQVAEVDWETHLPKMYSFWETVLLGKASFKGNPMLKHMLLNSKEKLTQTHFDKWMNLWNTTIDKHFSGPRADNAKAKAETIKSLMIYKIRKGRKPNFIQ